MLGLIVLLHNGLNSLENQVNVMDSSLTLRVSTKLFRHYKQNALDNFVLLLFMSTVAVHFFGENTVFI